MQNLLLFHVFDRQFAIRMPLVKYVQNLETFQLNQTEDAYPQSLLIDNKNVPLYDLSNVLTYSLSESDAESTRKILLTDDQNKLYAFLIDRIDGVVAASDDQIVKLPPIFKGSSRECFPEVLKIEDKLVLLMSPKNIEEQLRKMEKVFIEKPLSQEMRNKDDTEPLKDDLFNSNSEKPLLKNTDADAASFETAELNTHPTIESTIEAIVNESQLENLISDSIANIVSHKMKTIFTLAFSEAGGHLYECDLQP